MKRIPKFSDSFSQAFETFCRETARLESRFSYLKAEYKKGDDIIQGFLHELKFQGCFEGYQVIIEHLFNNLMGLIPNDMEEIDSNDINVDTLQLATLFESLTEFFDIVSTAAENFLIDCKDFDPCKGCTIKGECHHDPACYYLESGIDPEDAEYYPCGLDCIQSDCLYYCYGECEAIGLNLDDEADE